MKNFLADPQHRNILHCVYRHARSLLPPLPLSFCLPLPYLPPLNSMPMPFHFPLPQPASAARPKEEVLVPVEYQHRLYRTKVLRGCRKMARRKTFHLSCGAKSKAASDFPHVKVDAQNGGEPVVLINDDESRRPRPCESKKRLKVLLTKTLKNSDVGCLGRIILPKREAERYLPKLEDKVSMELAIRDLGSTWFWSLRFKFWSNSRSRMYVFEHTGDFVRQNGLQAGDSITLYEDDSKNYYFSVTKTESPAIDPVKALPNSLFVLDLPLAEKARVHEGVSPAPSLKQPQIAQQHAVKLEATDPYLEGSSNREVPTVTPDIPMVEIELSSWSSVSKPWEEAYRRELDDCYKDLSTLPECSGDGFSSLHDHSRMTG